MTKEEVYNKWGVDGGKRIKSPLIKEYQKDLDELFETVTQEEFVAYIELRHKEEEDE